MTLGGFFGVILTDIFQTLLIGVGAVIMAVMVFAKPAAMTFIHKDPAWFSLAPTWTLWSGFAAETPPAYQHFGLFGPLMAAGFFWMIFRLLGRPERLGLPVLPDDAVAARRPARGRDVDGRLQPALDPRRVPSWSWASSTSGTQAGFDAEKIMPLVLLKMPVGLRGLFMAVLLAALMSTISAMINVTSSVVINDFIKRYIAKDLSQKKLVRLGQVASVVAVLIGFVFSLSFTNIVTAWEMMVFVVVTVILVPATLRWHYWRFGAKAFVWSMGVSAVLDLAAA